MRRVILLFALYLALAAAQKLPSADDVPLSFGGAPKEAVAAAEEEEVPASVNGADEEAADGLSEGVDEEQPAEEQPHITQVGEGFEPIEHPEAIAKGQVEHGHVEEGHVVLDEVKPEVVAESSDGGESNVATTADNFGEPTTDAATAADETAAAADAQPEGLPRKNAYRQTPVGRRGKRGKRGKQCRLPGCMRCSPDDKKKCSACRQGWALGEDETCVRCGEGCKACSSADTCTTCLPGKTLVDGKCHKCAEHCLQCDIAGPGGCNECGPRRMLHVRLELQGEVHECLPCGSGCRACSEDGGCEACENSFYVANNDGMGCSLSWLRILGLAGGLFLCVGTAVFCLAAEDFEDPRQTAANRRYAEQRSRDTDRASVVRRDGGGGGGGGGEMRSRGGGRHESSPPRESSGEFTPSHHRIAGYSGIEIVDKY